MRPSVQPWIGVLGGGLALLVLPSCTAPVIVMTAGLTIAQAGASEYVRGVLEAAIPATQDDVVAAADLAIADLKFYPLRRYSEGRRMTIVAEDLSGATITISVIKKSLIVSRVEIRVGFWGDQPMSRLILAYLQKELVAMGSVPPPPTAEPEESPDVDALMDQASLP